MVPTKRPGKVNTRTSRRLAFVLATFALCAMGSAACDEGSQPKTVTPRSPAISTPTTGETPGETPGATPSATVVAPFKGEIAGVLIDQDWRPTGTALDACPPDGFETVGPPRLIPAVTGPGPLRIDPATMPEGVKPFGIPDAWECGGALAMVYWNFHADPGIAGVNRGGSPVLVSRSRGNDPVQTSGPRSRWEETVINGKPAALLHAADETPGSERGPCIVALYDPASNVLTSVIGIAAGARFCIAVAERVIP